ncbi:hypothetical protein [Pedobacter agri]|uniref:Uncharacterized protein n=1 Tax=Pedobacter agri TaxID=454586 RepID=A0A9X3DFA0_9SPHI|nr:hypothetical protein [Pedobacter agri]MCX3265056.1 hypothetical protein [Pedobacter agri]
MKKFIPFLFATGISIIAILSSFTLDDPELGVSTAVLSWIASLWLVSGKNDCEGCLS